MFTERIPFEHRRNRSSHARHYAAQVEGKAPSVPKPPANTESLIHEPNGAHAGGSPFPLLGPPGTSRGVEVVFPLSQLDQERTIHGVDRHTTVRLRVERSPDRRQVEHSEDERHGSCQRSADGIRQHSLVGQVVGHLSRDRRRNQNGQEEQRQRSKERAAAMEHEELSAVEVGQV